MRSANWATTLASGVGNGCANRRCSTSDGNCCAFASSFVKYFFARVEAVSAATDQPPVTSSKFCDLAFDAFVYQVHSTWHDRVRGDWLYLKINHENGENSTTIGVGVSFDADREAARAVHNEKVVAANFPSAVNVREHPYIDPIFAKMFPGVCVSVCLRMCVGVPVCLCACVLCVFPLSHIQKKRPPNCFHTCL